MLQRFRPDLKMKYAKMYGSDDSSFLEYIYHINAQKPRFFQLCLVNLDFFLGGAVPALGIFVSINT